MRILMNHAHQKVGGIFVSGLGSGLPFRHRSQFPGCVIHARSPGSEPGYRTVALLPLLRLFLGSYQWIFGTAYDWNVGSSN